mgnify:CR=1 FL=1
MDVTDLGTRFGVDVSTPNATELHVFDGVVEVARHPVLPGQSATRKTLKHEQAAIARAEDSELVDIPIRSASFVTEPALLALAYPRWVAAGEQLRRDPAVIAHYAVTGETQRDRLENLVRRGIGEASLEHMRWAQGRFPQTKSARFGADETVFAISDPATRDELTFAMWAYIDQADAPYSALISSDFWDLPGQVHWQIERSGPDDQLGMSFGVRGQGGERLTRARSMEALTEDDLGRWVHLAVSASRVTGQVAFYVDGELRATADGIQTAQPIRLGDARVGAFHSNAKSPPPWDRRFFGRVDEVLMMSRALNPEEIQALYLNGSHEQKSVTNPDQLK